MSVGYPMNKNDIDSRAGSLAVGLRDTFRHITDFKAKLDGKTDSDLTGLGFTQGEVDDLRSAYADLADLAGVYTGSASSHLSGTYDYTTFARRMTGVV